MSEDNFYIKSGEAVVVGCQTTKNNNCVRQIKLMAGASKRTSFSRTLSQDAGA